MERRSFLVGTAGAAGAVMLGSGCAPTPSYVPPANGTPFTIGVMSGLHSTTEAVLWTRLEPTLAPGATSIDWRVSTTADMSSVVESGRASVSGDSDWTAKVLVGGLVPNRSYWFSFSVGGESSPIGRARTLPNANDVSTPIRLAFASCQNWGAGWYNAWSSIAEEDVDAVVWLGDYIYESSGKSPFNLRADPIGGVDTLAGYRDKYKLYRSDPNLQAGHGAHPFVPVWDDHEFLNNCNRFSNLAEPERAAGAYRAWFEYMPVMPIDGSQIYRSVQWGRMAELFMLDSRQYRDRPANGFQPPEVEPFLGLGSTVVEAGAVDRTMLGPEQRAWLLDSLVAAQSRSVRWKLIGNQVMMAPIRFIDIDEPAIRALFPEIPRHDGVYFNMDDWDSYQFERDLLLGTLADQQIADVSVFTGDIHSFWQSSLRADYDLAGSPIVANEYVCGSISSSGPNIIDNDDLGRLIENIMGDAKPPFRYSDFRRNGYVVAVGTAEEMKVSYRVTRARSKGASTKTSMTFTTRPGEPVPIVERVNP